MRYWGLSQGFINERQAQQALSPAHSSFHHPFSLISPLWEAICYGLGMLCHPKVQFPRVMLRMDEIMKRAGVEGGDEVIVLIMLRWDWCHSCGATAVYPLWKSEHCKLLLNLFCILAPPFTILDHFVIYPQDLIRVLYTAAPCSLVSRTVN